MRITFSSTCDKLCVATVLPRVVAFVLAFCLLSYRASALTPEQERWAQQDREWLLQGIRKYIAKVYFQDVMCAKVRMSLPPQSSRNPVHLVCEGEKVSISVLLETGGPGNTFFLGPVSGAESCDGKSRCVVRFRVMCAWKGLANLQNCDGFGPQGIEKLATIDFKGKGGNAVTISDP